MSYSWEKKFIKSGVNFCKRIQILNEFFILFTISTLKKYNFMTNEKKKKNINDNDDNMRLTRWP